MEQMTTATGQAQATLDHSLESTVRKFNDTFNNPNAEEFVSFWADEGTLLNPLGNYGKGHEGIRRVFREDTAKFLEGTSSRFAIVGARKIADDHVLLDLESDTQNAMLSDGSRGPLKMHMVIVARKGGQGWKWLDVRAYSFRERPPQLH